VVAGEHETGTGQASDAGFGRRDAAPADLDGLDEAEVRRVLVAQTARFTADFVRWMEDRTCDGLSYQRLRLLQELHCRGPAIMRDLGRQLGVSPRNMTAIVDGLEEAQLVIRRPHPTDRRATLVELSPGGAHEAEQELGPRLDAMAEIFAELTETEREQFSATLARLTLVMQAGSPNPDRRQVSDHSPNWRGWRRQG
jgi:DNA-binding MarR family transcriptional regulator